MLSGETRSEHDLIGDLDIPVEAYWGVHTLRAKNHFDITGATLAGNPHLIRALARVKQAAVRANHELGLLDADRARAIDQA